MSTQELSAIGYDNKSPKFNGNNYAWWKNRIQNVIMGIDYECWLVVKNGPNIILKTDVEGNQVPKKDSELVIADYKLLEKNAKAMSILQQAIGRLGTTYAAVLDKDELVVAKRIYPWLVLSKAGLGFQSVIKSLSLAQHPNIVPILGFSEAPGERIILMEYVDTMSLDFYLHQHVDGPSLLGWSQRLKIAAGIARGVEYLHEKMAPQVVHGCVKPSNVLVDVEFCPKLCDYGLSFLASKNEKMGLLGYVDEEYWLEGKSGGACKESDVYGIGVVLLELLTGKRNEGGLLVGWVLPLIKEMRYSEFLDPRIEIPSNMKPIVRLGKVALACVGNSRKTRPKITQIVSILDSLDD
uniref:Protein kinase domain-containing protein n=1 Tax=Chenopodium quinoa TaxID=63459 RepID=A0A803LLN0_CHEQI